MILGAKDEHWLRRNPSHPGGTIKDLYLDTDPVTGKPGIKVVELAAKLGVSRVTLSRVVNERAEVSISLAMALESAGMGAADTWLREQLRFDLAAARRKVGRPRAGANHARETTVGKEAPADETIPAMETGNPESGTAVSGLR